MDLENFVNGIEGFQALAHTDKILHFAWFVHVYEKQDYVSASAIASCYDRVHLAKPSTIHPFLNSLASQKSRRLIRDGNGYRLERSVRDTFEAKYLQRQTSLVVSTLLQSLSTKITIPHQKSFLEETIKCFGCGAYRASVVMAWNLAFDHLCTHVLSRRLPEFNAQLAKIRSKSEPTEIATRADFEDLKESRVLEIARGSGVVSSSMFKLLKEKLDKRNIAAHPSNITISPVAAEDVIFDLVENVISKLQ